MTTLMQKPGTFGTEAEQQRAEDAISALHPDDARYIRAFIASSPADFYAAIKNLQTSTTQDKARRMDMLNIMFNYEKAHQFRSNRILALKSAMQNLASPPSKDAKAQKPWLR